MRDRRLSRKHPRGHRNKAPGIVKMARRKVSRSREGGPTPRGSPPRGMKRAREAAGNPRGAARGAGGSFRRGSWSASLSCTPGAVKGWEDQELEGQGALVYKEAAACGGSFDGGDGAPKDHDLRPGMSVSRHHTGLNRLCRAHFRDRP